LFLLKFYHDLAGIRVAIFLHLVSANTPIADDHRLLIDVVNVVTWSIVYGFLGLLWGFFVNKLQHCPVRFLHVIGNVFAL
jgi:hypothetical protein